MVRPRVFGLLAITLCLLVCMCANAKGAEESEGQVVGAGKDKSGEADSEKKALLEKYHNETAVAAEKLESLLHPAEIDVQRAEQKRDELNAALKELKELSEKAPVNSSDYVKSLYTYATYQLHPALRAVERATQAKKDVLDLQARVDDALVSVRRANTVDNARGAAQTAVLCADKAEKKLQDIKRALSSAEFHADNVLFVRNTAVQVLGGGKDKRGEAEGAETEETTDTDKPDHPVQNATEIPLNNSSTQPTLNGAS